MLCTNIIVLEALGFFLSEAQDFPGSLCKLVKSVSVVHLFITPLSVAEGGTEPSVCSGKPCSSSYNTEYIASRTIYYPLSSEITFLFLLFLKQSTSSLLYKHVNAVRRSPDHLFKCKRPVCAYGLLLRCLRFFFRTLTGRSAERLSHGSRFSLITQRQVAQEWVVVVTLATFAFMFTTRDTGFLLPL